LKQFGHHKIGDGKFLVVHPTVMKNLVTNLVAIEFVLVAIHIGGRLGVMKIVFLLVLTNAIDASRHMST
jgi:hypothetical protein